MAKFAIKKSGDQFRFNLKAGNGEVILTSEAYNSKQGCENGIASVKKNSTDEGRFELKDSKNEKFYFNLKAGNGEIIGTSQMYTSTSGRKNGVESVMKNAPEAEVIEE